MNVVLEKYSDTLPMYGIIFSNFASKNILATCEPFAGKYSRYMLRVSKLNIAEHDGVWHHSFCTCLYRAGTDASFFPKGWSFKGAIPHCILPYISLNYIKQLWKSFLGKPLKMVLYLVLSWNCSQPFIFHPISSMFFSCPSKELPIASDGLAW